jgi:hypothetical protein
MKKYEITKMYTMWSTDSLKNRPKSFFNDASGNGNRISTVSFGLKMWWMPTAYIKVEKTVNNQF